MVKSWRLPLRARASLSSGLLAVSMSVVVGCVSVTSESIGMAEASPGQSPSVTTPRLDPSALRADTLLSAAVPPADATGVITDEAVATAEAETAAEASSPARPTPSPTAPSVVSGSIEPAPAVAARLDPPSELSLDAATRAKLDKILANTVKNKGVAGLQAAVRLPSGQVWLGTAGNAEYSPVRSLRNDTAMSIASITKTFIAALILKLADEGKVDLDAPFGTYFKDARRHKTVTLRQLLSHTSGIYNYFEHPHYSAAARAWLNTSAKGLNSREHRWTYDDIMSLVKSGYCKPGKCYHYSNTNYVILGKVAETVEGAPLHRQLRRRFFEPLGLDHTVYQPAERPSGNPAHGHWNLGRGYSDHTRSSRYVPFLAAASAANAAGAIASTAEDLAVWADALYGGDVLSDESLSEMTTFLTPGLYGLGTDVASFAGHRGYGHRGGLRGFESSMWYFPHSGVSVVLLSNQGNWITDEPMLKLVRAVLGRA